MRGWRIRPKKDRSKNRNKWNIRSNNGNRVKIDRKNRYNKEKSINNINKNENNIKDVENRINTKILWFNNGKKTININNNN